MVELLLNNLDQPSVRAGGTRSSGSDAQRRADVIDSVLNGSANIPVLMLRQHRAYHFDDADQYQSGVALSSVRSRLSKVSGTAAGKYYHVIRRAQVAGKQQVTVLATRRVQDSTLITEAVNILLGEDSQYLVQSDVTALAYATVLNRTRKETVLQVLLNNWPELLERKVTTRNIAIEPAFQTDTQEHLVSRSRYEAEEMYIEYKLILAKILKEASSDDTQTRMYEYVNGTCQGLEDELGPLCHETAESFLEVSTYTTV
jgi:hypothetical protein